MKNGFPLKISVIMPVYNNGKSLNGSIKSVLAQTMPASDFELILSDDGSTDGSGDICRQLADANENIRHLREENRGVSAARNLGIKNARGKYIMFLDADDVLSKNALSEIYAFFEEHYGNTDVVTYRIHYVEHGRVNPPHKRFEILKERGVYSIDGYENMNILQTTINVCVKNDRFVLFDERLDLAEDQLFITSRVMKKRTIGFVPEAVYTYNRSPFSSSSLKSHPYLCFDGMTYFFTRLTELKTGGRLHPYIQSLILYNIGWRAASDRLVAHGLQAVEYERRLKTLRSFLEPVFVKTICNFIYADAQTKLFFLALKGEKCRLYAGASGYSVVCANEQVFCSESADIIFSKLNVRNGVLTATGRLGTVVPGDVTQELLVNGESVPLFVSNGSGTGQPSSLCFDLRQPINGGGRFDFAVRLGGQAKVKTQLLFGPFCRVNGEITEAACDGYILRAEASKGYITAAAAKEKELSALRKKEDAAVLRRDPRAFIYRAVQRLSPSGRIWLYSDAAGVYGNGYLQFMHDAPKKDGIKRYYVINDPNVKNALKNKALRRRETVSHGSRKHKLLFLGSEKILASYISPDIVCPFGKEPMRRYADVFGGEIIYLQHGVMHADLPKLYAKEKCIADKIVVSSPFEKKKLTNGYHYRDDDLIPCGMPELELLNDDRKPFRRLIYMPSWRAAYIGGFVNNTRAASEAVFKGSDFYKAVSELINSGKLSEFLREYDMYLDIKSHPVFSCYDKFFEIKNDRVTFTAAKICPADYPMLITDFSSCVYDFVYLRRPVVYFIPDYELFLSGALHSYCSLDVPLEEGFGALTRTAGELVDELKKTAANGFMPEQKYKDRMEAFFDCRKAPHRKLLYESCK